MGIAPLPTSLLPLPAIFQGFIFLALTFESAVGFYSDASEGASIATVFILITIEGICGGLA
jgi:battenin